MNKTEFDLELKRFKNVDLDTKGYEDKRYESKEVFRDWIKALNIDVKKYSKELSGDKPNMASFGSSSRFICKTFSKNNPLSFMHINDSKLEFEKIAKSPVRANFDMYCENENNHYYFEGKCHEIFDSHSPKFVKSYKEIFEIYGIKTKECNNPNEIIITDDIFKGLKRRITFDIKQFICHVLAIVTNKNQNGDDYLVYLLYAPKDIRKDYALLYDRFEEEYRQAIKYVQEKIDTNKSIKFKLFYKVSIEDVEPVEFEDVTPKIYKY